MIAALYVLYVLTCFFLILVVLLQAGKGDGMGAVFGGGGSNTLLGNRGAATFLSKLTVVSAVLFMLLSVILAYNSSAPGSRVGGGRVSPSQFSTAMGFAGAPGDGDEGGAADEETEPVDEETEPVDEETAPTDDESATETPEDDDQAAISDETETPAAGGAEPGEAAEEAAPESVDAPGDSTGPDDGSPPATETE